MLTAGATWYIDQDKTWAVSALSRYEFNTEQRDTNITPGQAYTLEWGISKSLTKSIEVGLVGFYQQQTTEDSGVAPSRVLDYSVALGPEVSLFCSKLGAGVVVPVWSDVPKSRRGSPQLRWNSIHATSK